MAQSVNDICVMLFLGSGVGMSGGEHLLNVRQSTPYGDPSDQVSVSVVGGVRVGLLSRHGRHHQIPPHRINYRANIWVAKHLGARVVIAVSAVGSLRRDWSIGDVTLPAQFVNRTWRREDTFFDGPEVRHAVMSEPYCPRVNGVLTRTAADTGTCLHAGSAVVVIEGPRYSTMLENRDWRQAGYDVISMTQYPEVALARELGLCYSALCIITDYARVLGDSAEERSSTHADVLRAGQEASAHVTDLLVMAIPQVGAGVRTCSCCAVEG